MPAQHDAGTSLLGTGTCKGKGQWKQAVSVPHPVSPPKQVILLRVGWGPVRAGREAALMPPWRAAPRVSLLLGDAPPALAALLGAHLPEALPAGGPTETLPAAPGTTAGGLLLVGPLRAPLLLLRLTILILTCQPLLPGWRRRLPRGPGPLGLRAYLHAT